MKSNEDMINRFADSFFRYQWAIAKSREFRGIQKIIRELDQESSYSSEQWNGLLFARLQKFLISIASDVPYYQSLFKEINFQPKNSNFLDTFKRIPILTKSILRSEPGPLINKNIDTDKLIENTTGGSTGIPLKFSQDIFYLTIANALDVHVRKWWGIRPFEKTAIIWGADREFSDLSLKERFYQWRSRIKSINAFRMTDRDLHLFCRLLKKWEPKYLVGYSSALEVLSKFVIANKYQGLKFKAVRSSAEMLWPHQRDLIKQAFQSPVYNFYGSREVNNLAAECPEENRLHLISTWRYIEIVNEKGEPVPDGQAGYMVVTDLSNYSMPFLRYRNEDVGQFSINHCECGRPSPVLDKLIGRSSDLILTQKKEIIHGEYFTHLFYGNNSIEKFQVHQKDFHTLDIYYVAKEILSSAYTEELTNKIKSKMGNTVQIKYFRCSEIPVATSGKYRFTISDVRL